MFTNLLYNSETKCLMDIFGILVLIFYIVWAIITEYIRVQYLIFLKLVNMFSFTIINLYCQSTHFVDINQKTLFYPLY